MQRTKLSKLKDGTGHLPPGNLATMLHRDLVAHQKRTADFASSWKRVLCAACMVLATLSLFRAVDSSRQGDVDEIGSYLTAVNATFVGCWVATEMGSWPRTALFSSPLSFFTLVVPLSAFQLVSWWKNTSAGKKTSFPADVIIVFVTLVSMLSSRASLKSAECALQASSDLAKRIKDKRS